MNLLRNYKWFFGAFFAWFLIGSACAWALIFSPPQDGPRGIAQFSLGVNGFEEKNIISASLAPPSRTLEAYTRNWEAEGWRNLGGNVNLAPWLAGFTGEAAQKASPILQLRVFSRKDRLRILGLLSPDLRKTYEWTAELPRKALEPPDPSSLLLPPPPGAFHIYSIATGKSETGTWSLPARSVPGFNPEAVFLENGFSAQCLSRGPGEAAFLLARGALRVLAVAQKGPGEDTLCWTSLKSPRP
jgi:hypothetical protein